jgi:hypothetical protein
MREMLCIMAAAGVSEGKAETAAEARYWRRKSGFLLTPEP